MKPGYTTTEFWLSSLVALAGSLLSAGVLGAGSQAERIAGIVVAALSAMGYSAARGKAKAGAP